MKRKAFNTALICALISSIMVSMIGFNASCQEMYDNIIRIRIIANSDTVEDQNLKLKIRDNILSSSTKLFGEANSYEDALRITEDNLDTLLVSAKNTVESCGYDYNVSIEFR